MYRVSGIDRDEIDRPAFRLALEAAPNGLLLVNSQGAILFSNQKLAQMFGYQASELTGKLVEILLPQKLRDKHPAHRKEFLSSPKTRPMGAGRDLFGARKDGSEFPVEIGLNPLVTDQETLVLAAIIDITERKKSERLVAEKNRELETLLYITSHDLREPLRSIQNFSQLLHDEFQKYLPDEAQDYLRRVLRGAHRMNNLLDDVLLLSRSKHMGVPQDVWDLNDLVQNVLERLQESIQRLEAKITVMPGLPKIRADRVWAEQAIFNLLTNALKFTAEHTPPIIEIKSYPIAADQFPDKVAIAIADRGPGIPEQYRNRIFELFQRAVSRDIEGTGAGLAIVRSVAEQHGGKTWVEDNPGGGSIFVITFPKG